MQPLPFRSPLAEYEKQALDLFTAWQAKDARAVQLFQSCHPRFLDDRIPWLTKRNLTERDVLEADLNLDDAQLVVARGYSFQDWDRLAEWVVAVHDTDSTVARFEEAVESVISGDRARLDTLLEQVPELVHQRSTIVTHFDPPVHRATLLHYLAANGVETYRQRSPKNAVDVAMQLLEAGADPNALADMYGGQCTTMSMLVSSDHPRDAGVQIGLIHTLIDHGASVEPRGSSDWSSPLMTALVFGFHAAAETLVERGAKVDNIATAAGLGDSQTVRQKLPQASPADRHRAFALAAQHGHVEIVRLLLDAGEDPNRYNPKGTHQHTTPLHQAVWSGHDQVVRLLVERGARLDIKDTIHQSTPLGWAEYGGKTELAAYLKETATAPGRARQSPDEQD